MTEQKTQSLLQKIDNPSQMKALSIAELTQLADELREFIIQSVSKSGGHLSSGLGTVELTVALHHVFNTPDDRLVWDVGHQSYPHKILTGRRDQMSTIRIKDGLSGFPRREESPYDAFGVGHSSTSISAALGMAIAAKQQNNDRRVAAIIGDGAFLMTCMEITTAARNKLGAIFVIFNDGELSQISQAQEVPYNRKTCTVLHDSRFEGVAMATGAYYLRVENNGDVTSALDTAWSEASKGKPVIVDINIDYSKKTRFTQGIVGTNLKRLPLNMKVKMISRALVRKVTG
mgnify:CR=1 FL=1